MIPLARKISSYWLEKRWVDWVLVVALAVAADQGARLSIDPFAITGRAAAGGAPLYFFQTLAGVSGVVLTVGTLAVTLLFAVTPNDRLQLVLEWRGEPLARLITACLGALLLATSGFALLFLFDPVSQVRLTRLSTVGLLAIAVLRGGRLWWVIVRTIGLLAMPPMAKVADAPWKVPVVGPSDYPAGGPDGA